MREHTGGSKHMTAGTYYEHKYDAHTYESESITVFALRCPQSAAPATKSAL